MQPHLRAVGSVVGSASSFSQIWGGGSIDGKVPSRSLRKENIHALRGRHTLNVVSKNVDSNLNDLPLGDPALLMPLFFNPLITQQEGVGIVPHFSDEEQVRVYLGDHNNTDIKLISVQQDPEDFISQMCTCNYIYSSSLHGLILADSYRIPNKWVSFSDKLLGGKFKFSDYYSTTISPDETVLCVSCKDELTYAITHPEKYCEIKTFIGDEEELLSSFPAFYKKV
jgi:pyruvyltransferase